MTKKIPPTMVRPQPQPKPLQITDFNRLFKSVAVMDTRLSDLHRVMNKTRDDVQIGTEGLHNRITTLFDRMQALENMVSRVLNASLSEQAGCGVQPRDSMGGWQQELADQMEREATLPNRVKSPFRMDVLETTPEQAQAMREAAELMLDRPIEPRLERSAEFYRTAMANQEQYIRDQRKDLDGMVKQCDALRKRVTELEAKARSDKTLVNDDYIIEPGGMFWVGIGNLSVLISHDEDAGVLRCTAYELDHESDDALDSIDFRIPGTTTIRRD